MTFHLSTPPGGPPRRGFTLVEVLAVITIIAIMLSVAAMGIQRIDRGQATTSALAIAEAVFEEARSAAIGRGTRARVMIHNNLNDRDDQDRDRYLSFMMVSVLNDQGQWEVLSRGTRLPSGVYFDPDLSESASKLVDGLGTYGTDKMKMGKRGTAKEVVYYEFNSEGICVDGESDADAGAAFVVIGGVRPPQQDRATIQGNNKEGFIVWRNGRTSLFRNPEQIESQ